MNRGVPPTARNARTGELTPPGTMARARSNRAWEAGASSGYGTASARYEVVTALPIVSAGSDDRGKRVVHITVGERSGLRPVAPGRPRRAARDRVIPWSDRSCPSLFSAH